MKYSILIISLLIFGFGCQTSSSHKASEEVSVKGLKYDISAEWLKKAGLQNVESIIYDKGSKSFYATNGKDYRPGTDGFISKISESGELIDLTWVVNLNRPTGMAIHEGHLYVADVNRLVAVRLSDGEITQEYKSPIEQAGLNDVAINQSGDIFISASFIHAVFKVEDGQLKEWVQDEQLLTWANGLAVSDSGLIVGGTKLCTVNFTTKEIREINMNPIISDFDGIASDGLGGYFLTTVENSGLYHLNSQNQVSLIEEGSTYFGDLTFAQDRLYIPRGDHSSQTYFISVFSSDVVD